MSEPSSDPSVREDRVDQAIAAYLEAVDAGQEPERDAFLRLHADIADELAAFFADRERFQRLAQPFELASPPHGVRGDSRDTPGRDKPGAATIALNAAPAGTQIVDKARSFGDYELLEEIARGGMGVVYKARQRSLNRVVALKMILAGQLASAADVRRFRTEAEAAARLDHPSIVPIYEIDEHEGQHYFSMKLIEGGDLVHQLPQWQRDPIKSARMLAVAARAVHYAHQRGLLHRDLKPANILLDSQGNPFISDFGLAKLMERDAGLTPSGGIVGTPKYMAPEQASPKHPTTTAVDVYGMGAILYEVLTGQAPFSAGSPLETMLAVLEKEPPRPRSVNPRVSADLETICLKCLRKDASERYGSALELAEDLERFAAGEPILARHTGPVEKFWCWCRRKPVVAALTGALLVLFLGSFILVTGLWQRAEANYLAKEEQRRQAEKNFEEAEKNLEEVRRQKVIVDQLFQQAHHAVRSFCIDLGQHRLARIPGFQMVRRDLIHLGLENYEKFVNLKADDPALQFELAETLGQMGDITGIVGTKTEALAYYRRSQGLFEKLLKNDPESAAVKYQLAWVGNRLGVVSAEMGRSPDEAYRQALALYEDLLRQQPENVEYLNGLGSVHTNLGNMYRGMGQPQDALRHYQKQLATIEKPALAHPDEFTLQRSLSIGYGNLGVLHSDKGEHALALECLAKSSAILEKLGDKHPESLQCQHQQALCQGTLAAAQKTAGKKPEALETLRKAHATLKKLVTENPQAIPFQSDFLGVCRQMVELQVDAKQPEQARELYRDMRAVLDHLARLEGSDPALQSYMATRWEETGQMLRTLKQYPEALQCYQRASEVRRKQMESRPQDPDAKADHGMALLRLAQMQWVLRKPEEALTHVRQALETERQAFQQAPEVMSYRRNLSSACRACAELVSKSGHLAEGIAAYEEFRKLWPADPGQQYVAARELALIASWVGKEKAELSGEEKAERTRYADRALQALKDAVSRGFKDAERLEKDSYFSAVRDRDEFKTLLREMKNK